MKKKIAIILPYKEIYSEKYAGAASIWVKDYCNFSKLKDETVIYGNLPNKLKPISKNFFNIKIKKTIFSKNKEYIDSFYNDFLIKKYEIIEIHNRPEYFNYLISRNVDAKLIFIFHNNPTQMRGSRKVEERIRILENAEKVFFVSRWTMKKFFEGLPYNSKSNCDVLYPSIKGPNKFNKNKKKQIIFTGKLNSSKGFDIFGSAIVRILNKYKEWSAVVAGNEPREKFLFKHNRLKVYNWIKHREILKLYDNSSISVVPSRWEEPFGRTAMESAAYGCATITSARGGLLETFDNKLVLKNLTSKAIFDFLNKLIKNRTLLKHNQDINFKNLKHRIEDLVIYLDAIKKNLLSKEIKILRNSRPKILHISNFNEKNNQRLFNISIASKISNGLIRNKCDVINFSYRNYLSQKFFPKLDQNILEVVKNYRPDLIILGHNNILERKSLLKIKDKKIKTSLWYEDHVSYYGPSWESNLKLIEKNNDLIDKYFITTHPNVIKTNISKNKINFLPIPVDENIENLDIYKHKFRYKDLFFALSHGVNFGGLRNKTKDEREAFLEKLLKYDDKIKFHILGINNDPPKWNYDLYKEMMICKMSLNLSRGKPLKYASSNRIASYMGNGILTFIDEKVKFQDFFNTSQMLFYKNADDLIEQIIDIKDNIQKINKISKNGKKRYFEIFNNCIISDYIISQSLHTNQKFKYAWQK
tara:strand:- start:259 stop:2358 length:2100 start_codon:yes stop_codon:yes gene_type:complete